MSKVNRGLYRNDLGAELVVTGSAGARVKVLSSDIYIAEARDDFGTDYYLVTASSLQDAGYKLVGGES